MTVYPLHPHASAPEPLEQPERRLTGKLDAYWHEIAQGRAMPEESDMDMETLASLWPKCFLIQTFDITERRDMNYTYLGREIIDAYQDESLKEAQHLLVSPKAVHLLASFRQVMSSHAPLIAQGEFTSSSGRQVRYRQSMLPLGKDGVVQAIFGGFSFKIY
jgi:hypothetical protein